MTALQFLQYFQPFEVLLSDKVLLHITHLHVQIATLDGLVVSVSAFGTEGRGFESTKGYTPDSDMCANRLVSSRLTVMLDIGKP